MVEKQFTARPNEEQRDKLNELFPDATHKEIFDHLFSAWQNPPKLDNAELISENEVLKSENAELKKEVATLHLEQKSEATLVLNENERLVTEKERLEKEKAELQQQIDTAKERPLAENELRFKVPPLHWSLLTEYAKRMKTQPENILIDMFLRYVVEQYNQWFFPFLVEKSEFIAVTGKSYKTVLNWLQTQK